LSLTISISLKLRLPLKPVPKAFAKASLAANLLEKNQLYFWIKID
jgi:hypothetical protein